MTMTLYGAPVSPFVRTVLLAVHELGLTDEVTVEPTPVMPTKPNRDFQALAPLRKIPALKRADGALIYDSPVIVAFLADHAGNRALFGGEGADRFLVETRYALA